MRFIGSRVKMIESSLEEGKKKEIKLQAVASIMPGSVLCFNNVPAGAILTAPHPWVLELTCTGVCTVYRAKGGGGGSITYSSWHRRK